MVMARQYKSRAQKQFAQNGLVYNIDINEVLGAMAAGVSLSQAIHNPAYIDAVVDHAFSVADDAMNIKAAALAQTGSIAHMYEWGTPGINKAKTNMRPNPLGPDARLWTNFTEGKGLDRELWWAYRPSVAIVPKPTVRDTGMSPDIINMLGDHVFRWKSKVMELGERVIIEPKKPKGRLLIPVTKANRAYVRPHDIKRGYTLTTFSQGYPGRKVKGNFTEFWTEFWNTDGDTIVNYTVNKSILEDYTVELSKPRTTKTLKPIGSFNTRVEIAKAKKKVDAAVTTKANTRNRSKRSKKK